MEGEEDPASDEGEAGGEESGDEPAAKETVRVTSGSDSPGHAVQQALGQAQGGGEGGGEEGEDEEDGGVEGVVPEDDGVETGVLSHTGTACKPELERPSGPHHQPSATVQMMTRTSVAGIASRKTSCSPISVRNLFFLAGATRGSKRVE